MDLKTQGNEAFRRGNWSAAVSLYTRALGGEADDKKRAILHSNRAAAHSAAGGHALALADARRARELDPAYVKAAVREAMALEALERWAEAEKSWRAVMTMDAGHAVADASTRAAECAAKAKPKVAPTRMWQGKGVAPWFPTSPPWLHDADNRRETLAILARSPAGMMPDVELMPRLQHATSVAYKLLNHNVRTSGDAPLSFEQFKVVPPCILLAPLLTPSLARPWCLRQDG